jgi:hypothetical protein
MRRTLATCLAWMIASPGNSSLGFGSGAKARENGIGLVDGRPKDRQAGRGQVDGDHVRLRRRELLRLADNGCHIVALGDGLLE